MSRARILVVASLLAASAAVLACADLIGLHDETGAPLPEAAPPPPAPDAATFCQTASPTPDFCDDFDGVGEVLGDRWDAASVNLPGLAMTADAAIAFDDASAFSAPNALFVSVEGTGSPALAALANALPIPPPPAVTPRGVRVQVVTRPEAVMAPTSPDGGFDSILPMLVLTARSAKMDRTAAMGLAVAADGYYLIVTDDLFNFRVVDSARLVKTDGDVASPNWINVSMFVGTRAAAVTENDTCNEVDAGSGVVVAIAMLGQKACLPLDDVLAPGDWIRSSTVFLGGAVHGVGHLRTRYDNLQVKLIP